jgi:hypothetical protein
MILLNFAALLAPERSVLAKGAAPDLPTILQKN